MYHGHHLDQGICRILDSLLAGDKFPPLESVGLHKTITFELFPELNEAKRLFVLGSSFWMDDPITNEDDEETPVTTNDGENNIEVEKSDGPITEIMEDDMLEGYSLGSHD